MRLRRTWRGTNRDKSSTETASSGAAAEEAVVRDAEESLVAALHESDTAVDAMQDTAVSGPDQARQRQMRVGIAGLVLAALALLVARRRS